jgi:hypothetical protein
MLKTTWDRVVAWRMRQQWVDRPGKASTVDVVRRLCGVQSQVPSAAAQQIDFYIRSPQQNPKNTPNREVFLHFFGMEVTWK